MSRQPDLRPAETSDAASSIFLRVPPFPGSKDVEFGRCSPNDGEPSENADLADRVRSLRIGGTYWAAQPDLPTAYLLARSPAALEACEALAEDCPIVLWQPSGPAPAAEREVTLVTGDCDPWHMLSGARALIAEPGDELCVIAALAGVATYVRSRATGEPELQTASAGELLAKVLANTSFRNPFTGERMTAAEAADLCGFWRRLIDSNRGLAGGVGFAFWKQDNVAALLWDGSRPFEFFRNAPDPVGNAPVAVWRSRASPEALEALERSRAALIEVEDGFLRSQGLGADCIPPLSIIVDRQGAYFDPRQPSDLEKLLQEGAFNDQLLERARKLRQLIVDAGLGKYDRGSAPVERRAGERRHILVPGQVEDDRSVQTGGSGLTSNLDLLMRVRSNAPDAYILYKPHPDVVAGHRRGAIPERIALQHADEIVTDAAVSSLIAMVDEVHVNTSLTGFEALLRNTPVTTYGVPFYAGWSLTTDLGPVPERRTTKRTLDELVAASLLLYPRYLDPLTGLPCPAEVVVARLSSSSARDAGLLVIMRRLQGKLMRPFRRLSQ